MKGVKALTGEPGFATCPECKGDLCEHTLASHTCVALETAINVALRAKLARAEREYLRTGSRAAQYAAYWCDCRLVERRRAGLGLGWWTL